VVGVGMRRKETSIVLNYPSRFQNLKFLWLMSDVKACSSLYREQTFGWGLQKFRKRKEVRKLIGKLWGWARDWGSEQVFINGTISIAVINIITSWIIISKKNFCFQFGWVRGFFSFNKEPHTRVFSLMI
jgi:hypothetical protein